MKKVITTISLVFAVSLLNAQPGPPTPDGQQSPTPIGFVELLVGAGAVLGGKKALDAAKDKGKEE